VTSTAVCGSDLHLYLKGVPGMQKGDVLGHEFMGIVHEVGPAVRGLAKGDRCVAAFCISCGECDFCKKARRARGVSGAECCGGARGEG
jgi:threonine dehydrogenase-like Zn-dependent dehydrogenase